jgi:hypothetical protein
MNCPNKSITKPVSKTISDQDMVYWWSDDKCNVFCWLALKENWGKILVAIGNTRDKLVSRPSLSMLILLNI